MSRYSALMLCLLIALPAWSANDFSGDPNCVALWNLESGALTVDSKGTNTLTNHGVTADTVNFQQGAASGDFELSSSQYLEIADASLDAEFPLRSGDADKVISICLWFRIESIPAGGVAELWDKYGSTANTRSFGIQVQDAAAPVYFLRLWQGHTGGTAGDSVQHPYDLDYGVWYHVGVRYRDSDKAYWIRHYDSATGQVWNTHGNFTNAINVENAPVTIGTKADHSQFWDGLIDEVVVFDRYLTLADMDLIRKGQYNVAASGGGAKIMRLVED